MLLKDKNDDFKLDKIKPDSSQFVLRGFHLENWFGVLPLLRPERQCRGVVVAGHSQTVCQEDDDDHDAVGRHRGAAAHQENKI